MATPLVVVSVHAHPDDEALLTAGTLARLAAAGHRVVLVFATAGEAGLADPGGADLGQRRRRELEASARAIGADRVELWGYGDSGWGSTGQVDDAGVFSRLDVEAAGGPVDRLVALLEEEAADVVTSYDEHGGYGHPDHVQVHRVVAAAAARARVDVLEATVDRSLVQRWGGRLRALGRVLPVPEVGDLDEVYTDPRAITHRVDVRATWPAKRASLAAHRSQAAGGPRTVGLLLRVPLPVLRRLWGVEWFRAVPADGHAVDPRLDAALRD